MVREHALVRDPQAAAIEGGTGRIPARFVMIGRSVYLSDILEPDRWDPAPPRGSRVVAYGGRPTEAVLADRRQMTTASTARQLRHRLASILNRPGESGESEFSLVVEQPDGGVREVRCLLRAGVRRLPRPISSRWIDHGVAYVSVPSFQPADWFEEDGSGRPPGDHPRVQDCIRRIDEVLAEAKEARVLILDLRGNEGGTDVLGEHLARHFLAPGFLYYTLVLKHSEVTARIALMTLQQIAHSPEAEAAGLTPEQVRLLRAAKPEEIDPRDLGIPTSGWSAPVPRRPEVVDGIKPFTGTLALLIDEACFSAADNFVACIQDQYLDLYILGSGTAGGTGAPRTVTLPHSGMQFAFCTMKVYRPAGGLIEGIGSEPDVWVSLRPEDLVQGRDPVLEAAIRLVAGSRGATRDAL